MMHLLQRIHPSGLSVTHRQNQLVFFNEGHQLFQSLYEAIRAAEHFIFIEYYLIRNDRTGTSFVTELTEAVERGVKVLLIYDTSVPLKPRRATLGKCFSRAAS